MLVLITSLRFALDFFGNLRDPMHCKYVVLVFRVWDLGISGSGFVCFREGKTSR